MILIIVESSGKIHKIESCMGPNYKVVATAGHIIDLEARKMSIDFDNKFEPIYKPIPDKENIIKMLKKEAKNSSMIYIAADKDREGEMIAWSIAKTLNITNAKRIVFGSVTKKDLDKAIKNVGKINMNLVNAQKARRILDRIIGYDISPILYKIFGMPKIGAGRVQTVISRLIVDKENEINKFYEGDMQSFTKFRAKFDELNATLYKKEGLDNNQNYKGQLAKFSNYDDAKNFLITCKDSEFIVAKTFGRKRLQNPHEPFNTSTLQQEASKKFKFNGKRTMEAAQNLYSNGYITYMRTDSVCLCDEAIDNLEKYIVENYGEQYYKKTLYESKIENTQEAHEAIRPCDLDVLDVEIGGRIGIAEQKLYKMIWKRTVACQMKPAEYNSNTIQIDISKVKEYYFNSTLENMTFIGYLIVYKNQNDEEDVDEDIANDIEMPKVGDKLNVVFVEGTQDYIRPPPRYDYASFVKEITQLSIGRPATFAPFVEKIIEKNYVELKDFEGKVVDSKTIKWDANEDEILETVDKLTIGKETGKYCPTPLGIMVVTYLVEKFNTIFEYKFTKMMEKKMDEIANGKIQWHVVIKDFYDIIHPIVLTINSLNYTKNNNLTTKLIGVHPENGAEIYTTITKDGKPLYKLVPKSGKPRFANLEGEPDIMKAIALLIYPLELGNYLGKPVVLNKYKNSFYLSHNNKKYNIDSEIDKIEDAVKVIKKINKERPVFKTKEKEYNVLSGEYGPYVKVTNLDTNHSFTVGIPSTFELAKLTLADVEEIVAAKSGKVYIKKYVEPVKKDTKKPVKKPVKKATKKVVKKEVVKKEVVKKEVVKKS